MYRKEERKKTQARGRIYRTIINGAGGEAAQPRRGQRPAARARAPPGRAPFCRKRRVGVLEVVAQFVLYKGLNYLS